MNTHDLLKMLGGPQSVADALNGLNARKNLKANTVAQWGFNDAIPIAWELILLQLCASRELPYWQHEQLNRVYGICRRICNASQKAAAA